MHPNMIFCTLWSMEKLVIGLMGVKESGKSTVASILAEEHEFAILEPGMQVMELLLDINPSVDLTADGYPYCLTAQEIYDTEGYLGFKKYKEGRRLLQELGTRIRERDPYFWVTLQMRAIESTDGNIVHTSVRFPNEARLVREWGGQLWEVVRNDYTETSDLHESEWAWRDIESDRVIHNNGTLSDLRRTVSDAIKGHGELW